MPPPSRRWNLSGVTATATAVPRVMKPAGYAAPGQGQGQQVQEARAGKASIEEINKERQLKQRVNE